MSKPKEKQTVDEQIKNLGGYTEAELRDLIEELEKLSENHKQSDEIWHHGFGCGLGRCVNELEGLIDDE